MTIEKSFVVTGATLAMITMLMSVLVALESLPQDSDDPPGSGNSTEKMLVISTSTEYDAKRAMLFDGASWTPLTKFNSAADVFINGFNEGVVHYRNQMYFYITDKVEWNQPATTNVYQVVGCSINRLGLLPFNSQRNNYLAANGHIYACFGVDFDTSRSSKSFCRYSTDPLFYQFNVTINTKHSHYPTYGLAASEG